MSSAVTLIVCDAPGVQPPCGCWLTCAPAAIYAVVVKKSTSTITEPDTAAPPPEMPPASATDESWGSVMTGTIGAGASTRPDLVETVSPPSASTCVMWMNAPESMNASVVTSGKTLTTMAPPTAVLPDEPLPARARFWQGVDFQVAGRDEVRASSHRSLGVVAEHLHAHRARDAGVGLAASG